MKLEIISPEKTYFTGEVTLVTLPGKLGAFTLLENHAPLISVLSKGVLVYKNSAGQSELAIDGGFAEVSANKVTVCVENSVK
ncbi:MAG: ATP synthase F1 subunit epsilon [Porphyromonadaceae bacterium CG2_30_38_12]|nr:MAG: ATP synthase F1 subunit epsilon [Porphyromonadaceae bacterium CG2_30_38_12]